MINGYCPVGVELDAVSVSVLLEVVGLVEKAAVTPLGSPETDRFTLPVNPYSEYTETLEVPEDPCPMLKLPPP